MLKVCEIYPGFDGEVNLFGQGTPTVFIRLQGCNLKCAWCDTPYAQPHSGGDLLSAEQIIKEARKAEGINKVTITGGEPVRLGLKSLIREAALVGYNISIETNGSCVWHLVNSEPYYRVHCWVIDYKLPGSGQQDKMLRLDYFARYAGKNDFIKFVIHTPEDFDVAIEVQKALTDRKCKARFAYSTTNVFVSPSGLADSLFEVPEILSNSVLNLQIHKVIWPHERRR